MRRRIFLKAIAVFLAFTIVFQTVYPTVAYAVTSGPTMPDVYGHQPADATDNVSLLTGDFNYTIPVTSIPEYPMAVGYSSNAGMNHPAGMFGFGINGFTGAVSRNLQGLPDDINGATKRFNYKNQKNWKASVEGILSIGMGLPIPTEAISGSISGNISLLVGYDNYKGVFGALGMGIGLNIAENATGLLSGGLNLGLSSHSLDGVSSGMGFRLIAYSYQVSGTDISNMQGKAVWFSQIKGIGESAEAVVDNFWNLGITDFSSQSNILIGAMSPLANVTPTLNSFSAATPAIPIPGTPLKVKGAFSILDIGNQNIPKKGYGFLYINNYNSSDREHLADLGIEGEAPYDHRTRTSPVYMQRDFFTINAQGMGGSMQFVHPEHGMVSRNYNRVQFRDLSFTGLGTERKEIEPWHNVTRSVRNSNLDIMDLLKKGEKEGDRDFDKTIFKEKELHSLRTDENLYNAQPILRMRGDLAGEFNLASAGTADLEPNVYELKHMSGTGGDSKIKFMREEKDMPLYFPDAPSQIRSKYSSAGTVQRGNDIKYYTVSQIVSNYGGVKEIDPSATGGNHTQRNNFAASFLSHYTYQRSSSLTRKDIDQFSSGNTKLFNLVKHLENLKNQNSSVNDAIADIRVRNPNGVQYIYNLPVFNKSTKSLSLQGQGINPPQNDGSSDYASLKERGNPKQRNRQEVTDEFYYPYAWLLTAIVGADYVDFDDIPGPSDGDLGYWVRIRYVKAADNYRWRIPYYGLEHAPGALHNHQDDAYYAVGGEKEIYYVSEIESSQYTARYSYTQRIDGIDAGGSGWQNGSAVNSVTHAPAVPADPTGNNPQFAVTKIELYKKHAGGDHSASVDIATERWGKLLRATYFKYDYSVCPKTPNNITNYAGLGVQVRNLPYHADYTPENTNPAGTGKLTLRKVQHASYESGAEVFLPSYQLQYYFDEHGAEYNPEYNNKQIDEWGNYKKSAMDQPGSVPYYNAYTETSKSHADANSRAFKLSKIQLPGGGEMQVEFESGSYRYVQDKRPFSMRRLHRDITLHSDKTLSVKIDITDLNDLGRTLSDNITNTSQFVMHGELAFYESNTTQNPRTEKELYIARDSCRIVSFGAVTTEGGRAYQEVRIRHTSDAGQSPFVAPFKKYLYSPDCAKMKMLKENFTVTNCNFSEALEKYQSLEKDDPVDAARKIIANVRNYFISESGFQSRFENCYGNPVDRVYPQYSYMRIPVWDAKYTGSRVASLSFADNFRYATASSGTGTTERDNVYTTVYRYDTHGNGTGLSEGVASVEMLGGYSSAIDIGSTRGAGFMPSPSVVYAKTTVGLGYQQLTGNPGDHISRSKGSTEYSFYTAKDPELLFRKNFRTAQKITEPGNPHGRFSMFGIMSYLIIKFKILGKKFKIRLPLPLPLILRWTREDRYHMQSYAFTDNYDMIGRPKTIRNLNHKGEQVSSTTYSYLGAGQPVKTYNGHQATPFTNGEAQKMIYPGRTDQTWSEAYYSKETAIQLVAPLLFMSARTNRHFGFTNMKYTYLPPLMTGITTTSFDGKVARSEFTGFDYYTGQPVETKSYDGSGRMIISRAMPAYWVNPEMGVSSLQEGRLNMLTPAAATYTYLNEVSDSKLLSAEVTQWNKAGWSFKDNDQRIKGRTYPSANTFSYAYESPDPDMLNAIYQTNGKSRSDLSGGEASRITDTYIKSASKLYVPYRNYVLKQELNPDGTFNNVAFNFASSTQNTAWQKVSEVTKIDHRGQPVENRDILDKYAASMMGYNGAFPLFSVANSTLNAATYSGGENVRLVDGIRRLDDQRILLQDAQIVRACRGASFVTRTLDPSDFISSPARVLDICVPANATPDKAFARINITYAHNTALKRALFISLDEGKAVRIHSDFGETFNGFIVLPGLPAAGCNSFRLAFDPAIFQSFAVDDYFTQLGVSVTSSMATIADCPAASKDYHLPDEVCNSEAHTGQYAFMLEAGKAGTRFNLDISTLPVSERSRKMKFLAWIHQAGADNMTLVIAKNGTVLRKAYGAEPYAVAGAWRLVRVEIDPLEYGPSDILGFYLQNEGLGSVYYDDIRVQPYHSAMQASVYDHFTGKLTASLNEDNFATWYQYDEKGRVSVVRTEIAGMGDRTIKRYLYNEQKKD